MAIGEFAPAFVIFPDFVVAGGGGRRPQRLFAQDGALFVALDFQMPRFGGAVPSVRQNNQHFARGLRFQRPSISNFRPGRQYGFKRSICV